MPDWADALIKIITFVLAFYGIMSAFAAKRSARAAEKQADAALTQAQHAETQALAALTQARTAEQQAAVQARTFLLEKIERYRAEIAAATTLTTALSETMLAAMLIDTRNPKNPENAKSAADMQTVGAKLRAAGESFETYAASEPDLGKRSERRTFIASNAKKFSDAARIAAVRTHGGLGGRVPGPDIDKPISMIINDSDPLQLQCDEHATDLQSEITELWLDVRKFEHTIRGP